MASQVLSGSSNVSYTNNTGQNVRIVINYMQTTSAPYRLSMNWAGVSLPAITVSSPYAIGRTIGLSAGYGEQRAAPSEIMLAPGQTFSAVCGQYNIVVIPEAG